MSTPTSLDDIPPTVADIFDVDPADSWLGSSLLDERNSRDYTISELCHRSGLGDGIKPEEAIVSIRMNDYKYIYNAQTGQHLLFDLNEDPVETKNVIDRKQTTEQELRQYAMDRIPDEKTETGPGTLSEDVEDRLVQLGYQRNSSGINFAGLFYSIAVPLVFAE